MNEITTEVLSYEDDKFHDECGVFGVFNHEDAATLVTLGLHALQHRGQEASGIVSADGKQYYAHRGLGLVDDIFSDASIIANLKGRSAVGHNRYATTGGAGLRNVQPLYGDLSFGGFTVAHNGDLTNASKLRKELTAQGSIFQSSGDTETIIHLVSLSRKTNVFDRVVEALRQIEGAYSLIIHGQYLESLRKHLILFIKIELCLQYE